MIKNIRRQYRERLVAASPRCDICGYDRHLDALIIHHVNMDRSNSNPENLAVLCANCHVRLHKVIQFMQETQGLKAEDVYKIFKEAEVKERNEAGIPDRATRTEGCEESQSGATHSDTSSTDMSHHEAARKVDRRQLLFKRYAELVRIYKGTEVRNKKSSR
jgi:hypothetical protein